MSMSLRGRGDEDIGRGERVVGVFTVGSHMKRTVSCGKSPWSKLAVYRVSDRGLFIYSKKTPRQILLESQRLKGERSINVPTGEAIVYQFII